MSKGEKGTNRERRDDQGRRERGCILLKVPPQLRNDSTQDPANIPSVCWCSAKPHTTAPHLVFVDHLPSKASEPTPCGLVFPAVMEGKAGEKLGRNRGVKER